MLVMLQTCYQELDLWRRNSTLLVGAERELPACITEARDVINKGVTTRYEMNVATGMRKRAGMTKSQFFLDAALAFKRDSVDGVLARDLVHPALYAVAETELGSDSAVKPEEAAAGTLGGPWACLGRSWGHLGPSGSILGVIWESFWGWFWLTF